MSSKVIYHIIYKTTNLVNGKIYVGKHSTPNLNDGYIGSGKIIQKAISKYKKQNFKCEHLFCAFTEQDAYAIEEQFVNEDFIESNDTYNVKLGGKGASKGKYNHFYGKAAYNRGLAASQQQRLKMSEAHKNVPLSSQHKTSLRISHEKFKYKIKCPDDSIITIHNLFAFRKERNVQLVWGSRQKAKGYELLTREQIT